MKREVQFTLEEIVKVPDTRELPLFPNGLIDAVEETKGYCSINGEGDMDYMTIDSIELIGGGDSEEVEVSDSNRLNISNLISRIMRELRMMS